MLHNVSLRAVRWDIAEQLIPLGFETTVTVRTSGSRHSDPWGCIICPATPGFGLKAFVADPKCVLVLSWHMALPLRRARQRALWRDQWRALWRVLWRVSFAFTSPALGGAQLAQATLEYIAETASPANRGSVVLSNVSTRTSQVIASIGQQADFALSSVHKAAVHDMVAKVGFAYFPQCVN